MSFGKLVTNLMRSMPGDVVDACQQIATAAYAAVAVVVLVAVDRLAEQRDFLAALVGELPAPRRRCAREAGSAPGRASLGTTQ